MAKYGETIRPLPTAEVELTGDRITASWQDLLLLVGRVAIGAIFVNSGFGKLMEISSFTGRMEGMGVPVASVMAPLGAAIEFFGGFAIILGAWTWLAALLVAAFTIAATYIAHLFWNYPPEQQADRSHQYDELYDLGYLRSRDDVWEEVYIDALDANGQGERAQQLRRAAFEERLSSGSLRAYLKKLPDFEDVEVEDWAMQHALGFRSFPAALYFFHQWPNPAYAAQLVLERASEIDGNAYYLLDPVARQIEGRHPLAATLLRRAMIDDTLDGAKSSRYKHAARHLLECRSLATMIRDYGTFETDGTFTSRLRASHARKTGFWKQVAEVSGTPP